VQLSNDPTLSSLPLLSTFLKYYSRPFLGIASSSSKQIPASSEPGTMANATTRGEENTSDTSPTSAKEDEDLVEQDIRDRFKKMCEGYFDSVSKKLVVEHKVSVFFSSENQNDCLWIVMAWLCFYLFPLALARSRSSES
jgi:regulator of nonsense transcripts 2